MAEKQLIVVVEGTMAMEPYMRTVVSDYIDKIIRSSLIGNELRDHKLSTSTVAMSLVVFSTHGSNSGCWVQRSGWTRDIALFLQWLSAIPLAFGGSSDAAVAEGLSEALMMFSNIQNGSQNQQDVDFQKHCILVAASNPNPLPTQKQNVDQRENCDAQTKNRLNDAEAVAKSFAQCFVSLSVICPKQLPILRAVYNAGKRSPRAADPPIDNVKNPHFLVLISENLIEAWTTLSHPESTTLPSSPSFTVLPAPQHKPTDLPPISIPFGCTICSQFAPSNFVKVWEVTFFMSRQLGDFYIFLDIQVGSLLDTEELQHLRRLQKTGHRHCNYTLISVDHLYTKYVKSEDVILFCASSRSLLFRRLRETKRCPVIKLPSQNLLLSISDTDTLMLGVLLPLDADPKEPYIAKQQKMQLRIDKATVASVSTKAATATIDAGTATAAPTKRRRA